MKVWRFFETHPVFHYKEFESFMASQGNAQPENCGPLLNYHIKAGHLINIRKFLYAVKPMLTQEAWVDPYLVTAKAAPDSILAYHTALELHGIAYTTFSEFTYLTGRQKPVFTFEGQNFRAITQPKALLLMKKTNFAVDAVIRSGIEIKLTSLERTIVDLLDRPDLGGGWEEIWRSFEYITQLNLDRLVDYALSLQNATTVSKVGYFLDQRPDHLSSDKKYVEKLRKHIPKQPHYMERDRKNEGKYIEKWQLIIPLKIINKTWEEPNADNI